MPFINPIVPIEIRSSKLVLDEYFLAICATNLKFFSINIFLASTSPFSKSLTYFCSSYKDKGSGKRELLDIYPKNNAELLKKLKNPAIEIIDMIYLQNCVYSNIC